MDSRLLHKQFKSLCATIKGVLGCFSGVSVYIPPFHPTAHKINGPTPNPRYINISSIAYYVQVHVHYP